MDEIKKGDEVKLKSGGPIMTVQDIGDYVTAGIEDGISCIWFEGKDIKEKVFDRATLIKHVS